jgi:hypothetical protein
VEFRLICINCKHLFLTRDETSSSRQTQADLCYVAAAETGPKSLVADETSAKRMQYSISLSDVSVGFPLRVAQP